NEARMEGDLADTAAYRPRVRWKVVDPVRQELHDDEIVAEAAMNHRPQRGIAAVAAIPIMLTIDLTAAKSSGRDADASRVSIDISRFEMTRGSPVLTLVMVTNSAGADLLRIASMST